MGFLKAGTPLRWPDSLKFIKYVREHGVQQFLNIHDAVKPRSGDVLRWGDEIEYHVVKFDEESKTCTVAVVATDVIKRLHEMDEKTGRVGDAWKPEFGEWMVEGTPGFPYGDEMAGLLLVEGNMAERRRYIKQALPEHCELFSMTGFPRFGRGSFTTPRYPPGGDAMQSHYGSDNIICIHPRFATLARNIRLRRGSKVNIRVPIFRDTATVIKDAPTDASADESKATPAPAAAEAAAATEAATDTAAVAATTDAGDGSSKAEEGEAAAEAKPVVSGPCSDDTDGFVHLDMMAAGMGMCCLQVTFQARDITESLRLYDQLAVLSPIVMALTAATPILKGRLTDHDVRWEVISASVDDRTPRERGVSEKDLDWQKLPHADETMAGKHRRLCKSRYASISSYLSESPMMKDEYNDIPLPVDEATLERLQTAGVSRRLSQHVAHLFTRDPLVIFAGNVSEIDDSKSSEHFENIQSTNWQSVRWKPPAPGADMGWRVELRTMEAQFTDFENAAFAVFSALINRVVLFFDLNMYMPISQVDENMARAHERNAAVDQKFFFRKFVSPLPETCPSDYGSEDPDAIDEMTMHEILMGKGKHFPGLIPLILTYLDIIQADSLTKAQISHYLTFIEKRSTGELLTPATWIRQFVRSHPDYKRDSVVSPRIEYDLLHEISAITSGRKSCSALLGNFLKARPPLPEGSPPVAPVAAADDDSGASGSAGAGAPVATGAVDSGADAGASASGASSQATPAKPRRRLRGSSFASEASMSECFVIKQLVERYAITTHFNATPAFLSVGTSSAQTPPPFLMSPVSPDAAKTAGRQQDAAASEAGAAGAGAGGAGAGSAVDGQ